MKCRICSTTLEHVFLDLGTAPPSNAFLKATDLARPETYFPLKLHTCANCLLVQVDEVEDHSRLFPSDYVYHSSVSRTWLEHCRKHVERSATELSLDGGSLVVELASNDGYLLQYVAARGIPCLGVEPTEGPARVARERGIETIVEFFGAATADRIVSARGHADLVVANNVLAHVPDVNDFVSGIGRLLAAEGTATIEFPHLMALVGSRQFDTVYHEHFSYFSMHSLVQLLSRHGLRAWRIEDLGTHGGSLRAWICRGQSRRATEDSVPAALAREADAGMDSLGWYDGFQATAEAVKDGLLRFLLDARREGRRVVGYGAAAKGNTLLNFAGVRRDLLPCVADASPYKQGLYLPGSRIPVVTPEELLSSRPDVVLILPWNLRAEICDQLAGIRAWGGRFATAVPSIEVW